MHPPYLQCWQIFFPPLFLSVSFLGSKALYIVISFVVHWSVCPSSSLVYFKNGSVYLTRETISVFIPLIRFLLQNLVSRCFLVRLKYFFFLSSPFVWWCPFLIFPSKCNFPFLQTFWFYLHLAVIFLPLFLFFPLFIISMAHFYIQSLFPF